MSGEPIRDYPIWRPVSRPELPVLSADVQAEVCVIGLGGSGLNAIAEFVAAGVDVVGIDAVGVAAAAAGANGGFLLAGLAQFYHRAVAQFGKERALGIYRLTRGELDRLFADNEGHRRRSGSLRIAADAAEESDCVHQIEAMLLDGLPAQPYLGAEGRGVLIPDDGVFDPAQHWHSLARKLQDAGARLFGGTPALEVQPQSVRTPAALVRAPVIVVAVDGGLERVLPQLAGEVRSARLQMLATAPVVNARFERPVYFRDGHDYWQQLPNGCIALGGGRDIGGEAEWQATGTSDAVQQHMQRLLRERIDADVAITHRWSAGVAFTRSGLPVFGEKLPGVFVTGAYNGTGNVLGALCGRALAQQILGRDSELASYLR